MLLAARGIRPESLRADQYSDAMVGALLENEGIQHLRAMSGHEMHVTFLNDEGAGAEGESGG